MKTVLATGLPKINYYMITKHQEFLVVNESCDRDSCGKAIKNLQPDLLVISDVILGSEPENAVAFLRRVIIDSRDMYILLIISEGQGSSWSKALSSKDMDEFKGRVSVLYSPVKGSHFSEVLYGVSSLSDGLREPRVIAVWSPKSGDGGSTITEAIGCMLWENKPTEEDKIGIVDYNIRFPNLRLRLGLGECNVIDDVLPFISGGKLTREIIAEYEKIVEKRKGLFFLGGIRRPELFKRYNNNHFNEILETCRKVYRYSVIDSGNLLDVSSTHTALKNADCIFAVIQPNYISKHCLKSSLKLFPSIGIDPRKVKVIINRYDPRRNEEPGIILSGLNIDFAGSLIDLGDSVSSYEGVSFFKNREERALSGFAKSLVEILEKQNILPESKKNTSSVLKQFIRSA